MNAAQESTSLQSAPVRLRVERPARVGIDAARLAFADLAWLGRVEPPPADEPGVRRIATALELPILDGSASGPVRKAAIVELGPVESLENGALIMTLAWRSATAAPLFPVFIGELHIDRHRVVLDGGYSPPFGRLGLMIDAALLNLVARRTAQALLARVVARIER